MRSPYQLWNNYVKDVLKLESFDTMKCSELERHENNLKILNSLGSRDRLIPSSNHSKDTEIIDYQSFLDRMINVFDEYETEIQTNILTKADETIQMISNILKSIDGQMFVAMQHLFTSTDGIYNKLKLLETGQKCISSVSDVLTLTERTQQFIELIDTFDIVITDVNALNRIKFHENTLNVLRSLSKSEIVVPSRDWIAMSPRAIQYQTTNYNWYSFLVQTIQLLASYDVQKMVNAYNVANLSDWGQLHKPQGLLIDKHNFDEFVKRVRCDAVFEPIESKFNELNEILNTTLKSPLQFDCNEEKMMVKGI